ncbi:MAG: hypothetical protein CM1200mP16_01090 [Nitrospina sp.]|nr:MAG: hypothetical protein CM1200mP16_01090 [Nitrospina sp.]
MDSFAFIFLKLSKSVLWGLFLISPYFLVADPEVYFGQYLYFTLFFSSDPEVYFGNICFPLFFRVTQKFILGIFVFSLHFLAAEPEVFLGKRTYILSCCETILVKVLSEGFYKDSKLIHHSTPGTQVKLQILLFDPKFF